jgi:RNA polymerase sigma-70 factor (ECF subfamily)
MSGLPLAATAVANAASDFEALFQDFYPKLARLLYRVTGDIGRAEEVAAEAFCRLHRRPPAKSLNVEGWLYRTGLRLALDQLRRQRRRERYEHLAAQVGFSTSRQPSDGFSEFDQSDERQCVRRVLASLKRTHANLLVLDSEGLNYAELAAALELKRSSVGTLLFRARRAFRKEYLRRYGQR